MARTHKASEQSILERYTAYVTLVRNGIPFQQASTLAKCGKFASHIIRAAGVTDKSISASDAARRLRQANYSNAIELAQRRAEQTPVVVGDGADTYTEQLAIEEQRVDNPTQPETDFTHEKLWEMYRMVAYVHRALGGQSLNSVSAK